VNTSNRFDPNAYKLMKKSSYDFSKPPPLGNFIEARPYGLSDTQKMIQRQGARAAKPIIGLGNTPSQMVKIWDDRKRNSHSHNTS